MAAQQWTHSHMMVMSFYNYNWKKNTNKKISVKTVKMLKTQNDIGKIKLT